MELPVARAKSTELKVQAARGVKYDYDGVVAI